MSRAGWQHALLYFENRCAYCRGEGPFTRDHVIPRALGGRDVDVNIVPACATCNKAKGIAYPKEWCTSDVYARIEVYFLTFGYDLTLPDLLSPEEARRQNQRRARQGWHGWFRAAVSASGIVEPERLAKQIGVSRKEMRGYYFGRFQPSDPLKKRIAAALMNEAS
jgi:hypothetical protein